MLEKIMQKNNIIPHDFHINFFNFTLYITSEKQDQGWVMW